MLTSMDYSFPHELKEAQRWLRWRYEERKGKQTKVPINASNGQYGKSTDASTWSTYDEAINSDYPNDGLGFVLGDGITGIDLDHCFVDGALEQWAQDVVDLCQSYTEVSPSGEGLHILVKGQLPGKTIKLAQIEMYSKGRYFTMTGDVFAGFDTLSNNQDALNRLWHEHNPEKVIPLKRRVATHEEATLVANIAIIITELCTNDYFLDLWEKHRIFPSQSEYDLAIANFCTQLNLSAEQIQGIIYEHRIKWNEQPSKALRTKYINDTLSLCKTSSVTPPTLVQPDYFVDSIHITREPKPQRWLVKKYFPQSGIVWLAGQWSTYKTFLALQLAYHIAIGKTWCGNTVAASTVLYIAGEGFGGLGKRLRGLELHNKQALEENQIIFTRSALMFNEPAAFAKLKAHIKDQHASLGLVVLDTKSANMSGSDSDAAVMNDFINHARALEREFDCMVLIIDHIGHENSERPRGVSQQMGAADAIYMLTRDAQDIITFATSKDPKDFETPPTLKFKAQSIELPSEWNDEDGQAVTTLILTKHELVDKQIQSGGMKEKQKQALSVLNFAYREAKKTLVQQGRDSNLAKIERKDWLKMCRDCGIARTTLQNIVTALEQRGLIKFEGVHVYLNEHTPNGQ